MTTLDSFKSGVNELKEFLDWNRFMLAGLTLWVLLVVLVNNSDVSFPSPTTTTPEGSSTPAAKVPGSLCTESNPFPGVVFIVGLVLAAGTTVAEAFTDFIHKDEVIVVGCFYPPANGQRANNQQAQANGQQAKDPAKVGAGTIILRAASNIGIFYTIIAISSFNWFPINDNTCFIDFYFRAKWISLATFGSATVVLLALRVIFFDLKPVEKKGDKNEDDTGDKKLLQYIKIEGSDGQKTKNNRIEEGLEPDSSD